MVIPTEERQFPLPPEMPSNEGINVCIFKKGDGKDHRKTRKQMSCVNGPLHHERLLLYLSPQTLARHASSSRLTLQTDIVQLPTCSKISALTVSSP